MVESDFGRTTACRSSRRFARRGLADVAVEREPIRLTCKLLRLFRTGVQPVLP